MKVSLKWLGELVDFGQDAHGLAQLLTNAGVEVEGIETSGVSIDKVVVAQILETQPHPNADRLSVCRVEDGSGVGRQIVCGAKNFKVGDKVPLALPGAVMPGDFKIKVGKLRGVESEGMMCSAKELAISEESEGLLILDPGTPVGTPLRELFPSDTVLDLEITPNRADLLSHEGIAREVGALTGRKVSAGHGYVPEEAEASPVEVQGVGCSFYTVRRMEGVRVGASPEWMRARLESLGVRSINNVVDVTNWVMLETGQPLHAFDAAKVRGELRVRYAVEGESLLALDGKQYVLGVQDVVIADDSGPVAIAGVMGGEATGVSGETTEVLLESACFAGAAIRRTSRRLGLSSDSSYRFERGVDAAGVLRSSQRAAVLLGELAGARAVGLRVGVGAKGGVDSGALLQGLTPVRHVPLRLDRVAALLGVAVSETRIVEILSALGLTRDGHGWDVPSFREDLTREVDLIEEIARVVGIEKVPGVTRACFSASSETDAHYDRLMRVRRAAVGQGLYEARTLTLLSETGSESPFARGPVLRVKNPLNEDQRVLRPSLVPGLVAAAARNGRVGVKGVRLFEVGRVFSGEGREERTHLGVVLAGPVRGANWRESTVREVDLFDLKGVLGALLGREVEFVLGEATGVLGLRVGIVSGGREIGMAGQWRPSAVRSLDLQGNLLAAEVDLALLLESGETAAVYREIPRFPAVTRDVALQMPRGLANGRVLEVLAGAGEALLSGVELFDVFEDPSGQKVPVGFKSVAYSLTYRSAERTLTAEEVAAAHQRLKERLISELGVQARE